MLSKTDLGVSLTAVRGMIGTYSGFNRNPKPNSTLTDPTFYLFPTFTKPFLGISLAAVRGTIGAYSELLTLTLRNPIFTLSLTLTKPYPGMSLAAVRGMIGAYSGASSVFLQKWIRADAEAGPVQEIGRSKNSGPAVRARVSEPDSLMEPLLRAVAQGQNDRKSGVPIRVLDLRGALLVDRDVALICESFGGLR